MFVRKSCYFRTYFTLGFLGETAASMEMESTKKRTGLEMEEGNQEEESNDGSRRSTSPEPARKKKKIDPVSDKNIVQ